MSVTTLPSNSEKGCISGQGQGSACVAGGDYINPIGRAQAGIGLDNIGGSAATPGEGGAVPSHRGGGNFDRATLDGGWPGVDPEIVEPEIGA